MTEIDQIVIQRVGGWVLVSEGEWLRMSEADREELLNQQAVQFFAHGEVIDPETAAGQLDPAMSRRSSDPGQAAVAKVELQAVELLPAVYRRVVIDGPSWQVQRELAGEDSIPFAPIRGRAADAYDLDTEAGGKLLVADLVTDSFGIQDVTMLSADAVEQLHDQLFESALGDRFWEIEAEEIRAQVEESAVVRVVK